jgi:hypothetical protein
VKRKTVQLRFPHLFKPSLVSKDLQQSMSKLVGATKGLADLCKNFSWTALRYTGGSSRSSSNTLLTQLKTAVVSCGSAPRTFSMGLG